MKEKLKKLHSKAEAIGEKFNFIFKEYKHDFTFARHRGEHTTFGNDGRGWAKIFIQDKRGVQVGRITLSTTLEGDDLYICYIKIYKKHLYAFNASEDLMWIAFSTYLNTGKYISLQKMNCLLLKAEEAQKKDYRERALWREQNNPQKRRRRLQKRHLGLILTNFALEKGKQK